MPYFEDLPQARRYNTLRLLGHNYGSTTSLYAISLATDQRRPVFADIKLAKATLKSLLSDQTLVLFDLRAFCLMPNHLHLVTGVKNPTVDLSTIMGRFESYTTQLYWKRAREIVETRAITLPGSDFHQNGVRESRELITVALSLPVLQLFLTYPFSVV